MALEDVGKRRDSWSILADNQQGRGVWVACFRCLTQYLMRNGTRTLRCACSTGLRLNRVDGAAFWALSRLCNYRNNGYSPVTLLNDHLGLKNVETSITTRIDWDLAWNTKMVASCRRRYEEKALGRQRPDVQGE